MAAKVLILIRAIHLLIILGILAFFGYNLRNNLKNLDKTTQSFTVITNNSLVPPAITLCLTEEVQYNFSLSIYGNVVAQGENPEYLKLYPSDDQDLANLTGVDRCWILASPDKGAILHNPPPANNVPDMNFTYTRVIPNNSTTSPILINIFDPLELSTNFQYSRFLRLDPDVNRVVLFSRTKHVYLNNTKETNDVVYNIIDEHRDPTDPTSGSATSSIIIRPISFNIAVTSDVQLVNWWTILVNSFTLIGVLFSSIYVPLIGSGKFRPWGFLYVLFNYNPVKNISKIEEEGRITKEDTISSRPEISDILKIYLDKVEDAQYKRHR